ncbi:hypothetical protein Scep_020138 [Stephania cephalantha]|uniref:Uncharacterized protein n=1 Tax=Stephania cephalantha TaxID=152367 RepID=A0AAP0IC40_9MAGN
MTYKYGSNESFSPTYLNLVCLRSVEEEKRKKQQRRKRNRREERKKEKEKERERTELDTPGPQRRYYGVLGAYSDATRSRIA